MYDCTKFFIIHKNMHEFYHKIIVRISFNLKADCNLIRIKTMASPDRQDGFPSLVVPEPTQIHDEEMGMDVVHKIFVERPDDVSSKNLGNKIGDAVEFWSNADLLSAFTSAAADRSELVSAMDLDQPSSAADQSMYDPIRPVPCFGPPKRYFRTFWISTARRLIESAVAV